MEQQRKDYYNHSIKPKKLVRDVRLSVLQDIYWSPYLKYNKVKELEFRNMGVFRGALPPLSEFSGQYPTQNFIKKKGERGIKREEIGKQRGKCY